MELKHTKYERDWNNLDDNVYGDGCNTCRHNQEGGCVLKDGMLCYDASFQEDWF